MRLLYSASYNYMTVREKQKLRTKKSTLRAFRAAKRKAGMWPELKEVADELGLSVQQTEVRMKALVDEGEMEKVARYRGYRLVSKAPRHSARRAS